MSFSIGISHGCDATSCPCKNLSMAMTIWSAAELGSKEHIVARVLRNSALVNKLDNYGYTPLHYASQHNHVEIVQFLLSKGASPDMQNCGATPLHRAAFSGCIEVCKLLVDAGADVNAQDYSFGDLNTPCHKAALAGHHQIVKFLLDCPNFDPTVKNSCGQTVFDIMNMVSTSNISEQFISVNAVTDVAQETQQCSEEQLGSTLCDKCCKPSLSFAKGPNNMLVCLDCRYI